MQRGPVVTASEITIWVRKILCGITPKDLDEGGVVRATDSKRVSAAQAQFATQFSKPESIEYDPKSNSLKVKLLYEAYTEIARKLLAAHGFQVKPGGEMVLVATVTPDALQDYAKEKEAAVSSPAAIRKSLAATPSSMQQQGQPAQTARLAQTAQPARLAQTEQPAQHAQTQPAPLVQPKPKTEDVKKHKAEHPKKAVLKPLQKLDEKEEALRIIESLPEYIPLRRLHDRIYYLAKSNKAEDKELPYFVGDLNLGTPSAVYDELTTKEKASVDKSIITFVKKIAYIFEQSGVNDYGKFKDELKLTVDKAKEFKPRFELCHRSIFAFLNNHLQDVEVRKVHNWSPDAENLLFHFKAVFLGQFDEYESRKKILKKFSAALSEFKEYESATATHKHGHVISTRTIREKIESIIKSIKEENRNGIQTPKALANVKAAYEEIVKQIADWEAVKDKSLTGKAKKLLAKLQECLPQKTQAPAVRHKA